MTFNRQLRTATAAFLLLAGVLAQSGCVPFVVSGAAAGARVVAQERPVGTVIDDTVIRARIANSMLEFDAKVFQQVDIQVIEGRVLLTGLVPEPANRLDAARISWQADGVSEVINEVEVKDRSTVSDAARDTWISTKLRSIITFDGEVRSVNYTIETVNRTVYLMGIAYSQTELDRVVNHARQIDYVRHVVPYVRILSADPGS